MNKTTETCSNCGGSGLVRCYDCDHGYKVNSWGDRVMCDCDEHFKRECRHCAGTGEVELESAPQQQDQPPYAYPDKPDLLAFLHAMIEVDQPIMCEKCSTVHHPFSDDCAKPAPKPRWFVEKPKGRFHRWHIADGDTCLCGMCADGMKTKKSMPVSAIICVRCASASNDGEVSE